MTNETEACRTVRAEATKRRYHAGDQAKFAASARAHDGTSLECQKVIL
jgi:hypothetical protein